MLERTINWLLVANIRYALDRDNVSAFSNFKMSFEDAIKDITDPEYLKYTLEKLIDEIESELMWEPKKTESYG